MLETILIIIGLTTILIAALFDIKTKEVPNWLTYNLIIIAIVTRLFFSISYNNYLPFFYGIIGAISMFLLGNLMYYTKQWGGGDTKLLIGMGATFFFSLKFLIILLLSILMIGAIYGIIWSIYLSIKHKTKFIKEYKKQNQKRRCINILTIILLLFSLITYFLFPPYLKILIISTSLLIMIYLHLILLMKTVEKACMYKTIPVSKLTEGDWIVKNIYINKKLVASPKDKGITKEQISIIKKSKIKNITIKEGIPFVPVFFIATLLALFFL